MDVLISAAPPDCGRRIVPKIIDDIASSDPQRTFIAVRKSSRIEDGFVNISYSVFARAVNRCSWWMESELGRSKTSKTVLYFGPLDYRYYIVLLAATKTGHATMLLATGAPAIAQEVLAVRPLHLLSVPEIDYFMDDGTDVEIYQWQGAFDEVKDKLFMILHTSGSTGLPKPVFVTHRVFASNDAHQLIPSLGGSPTVINFLAGKRIFVAFPPFHAANLFLTIGYNVFSDITCVLPPPGPPTADVVNAIHRYGDVDGSILPPSTLIDIFNTSEYLLNMTKKLEFVAYVGGVLSKEVGDSISSKMKLLTLMGATELGYLPVKVTDKATAWQCLPFSPFLGHEYRQSRDGLSELVIVRNSGLDLFQGVFSVFPNLDEYATSDLYELDPTDPGNPDSWLFRARNDDIIAFSNAEKFNPVTMEAVISSHSAVQATLVGGHGEFQAALLVQPKADVRTSQEKENLLNDIWPIVMQANRDCPAHGRIFKNYIMFTTPGKPLPLATKGTVQRYAALELYSEEFRSLYATLKGKNELQPGAPADQAKSIVKESTTSTGLTSLSATSDFGSGLDVRIEEALNRLLPDALLQHLGPALVRMTADLLNPGATQQSKEVKATGIRVNGLNPIRGPEPSESSLDDLNTPTAQADGAEKAYSKEARTSDSLTLNEQTTRTLPGLQDGLRHAITESTYLHGLSDQADFFNCGLDSVQVPGLTEEINELLTKLRPDVGLISTKVIYEYPSFERLLSFLQKLLEVEGKSEG
ncbi:MAG: hypothetical protein Q9161_007582 [Pseudevernia consocians]